MTLLDQSIIPYTYSQLRVDFGRAGEPKRLVELEGGHYSVYRGPGADEASLAAADWFSQHLVAARPSSTNGNEGT